MASLIDLTGQRFGHLLVLVKTVKPANVRNTRGQWLCRCDCGNEVRIESASLRNGPTKSCGCQHDNMIRLSKTIHGHSTKGTRSSTYNSWAGMLTRCRNPKSAAYKYYGARGISVCDRWLVFETFLTDMGECPRGKSIDRINNDGDYEPANCRWATRAQQASNQRKRLNPVTRLKGIRQRYNGRFEARINQQYVGVFDTVDEARDAIEKALKGVVMQ